MPAIVAALSCLFVAAVVIVGWLNARGVGRQILTHSLVGFSLLMCGVWIFALAHHIWIAAVPIVMAVLASRGPVEDVVGGVVIAVSRTIAQDDDIVVGDVAGRVVHVGIRHTLLRAADESEVQVPNRMLLSQLVRNVSATRADTPVEVDLPLPSAADPATVRQVAFMCAVTSPFASMRRHPETFLIPAAASDGSVGAGGFRVRIRGFVFDSAYAETYRSHILEAWLEAHPGEHQGEDGGIEALNSSWPVP